MVSMFTLKMDKSTDQSGLRVQAGLIHISAQQLVLIKNTHLDFTMMVQKVS